MKQYEVWWATLAEPIGRRPVLLLSRNGAYDYLNNVIVAQVTTTIRGIPVEVALGRAEGLKQKSVVNLDNVHVIAKESLRSRIGTLKSSRAPEVKRALGWALEWYELKHL